MELVIEFISNLLYMSYYILTGHLLFDFEIKNKKIWDKVTVLVFMTLVITLTWFYFNLFQKFVIHVVGVFVVMVMCFNERKRYLILFYAGMVPTLAMLSLMFEIVVSESFIYMEILLDDNIREIIAMILLFLYIFFLGRYFKKKHKNGLRTVGKGYLIFFLLILLIDSIIVPALGMYVRNELQTSRRGLFVLLYIGIVLGILVQLVLLINALLTRKIHIENEKLAKQFLDNQKEYYTYLEKREYETKKFRHDIRSHLLILNDYVEKEDYTNAKLYLKTLNEKVETLGRKVNVNNDTADAILNKFYHEAQEKGISLKVAGHFPEECNISAYDICTVLSNLLSNAILAESQCNGNCVTAEFRYNEMNEMFIVVENDYLHELKRENGIFKTSKSESYGHGLGLSIVEECVEKYDGTIIYNVENNLFRVMISIKNESKELKCK